MFCSVCLLLMLCISLCSNKGMNVPSRSATGEALSTPLVANGKLEIAITSIINSALIDDWIVLIVDGNTTLLDILNYVLVGLHTKDRQIYILTPEDNDWENQLPPSSVLQGRCSTILVINQWPFWLDEASDRWSPNELLVINMNASVDSQQLLDAPQIQKSPSLALMESFYESLPPVIYTSHPFLRDAQGGRTILYLLGRWDETNFQTKQELFPDRFKTFGGEVLHLASDLDDYPLIYEDGDHLDGTNIRILNVLGEWLNFTYTTTVYAADENWGELVNGSWNGLLGEVFMGTKNLTVNYFTVVYERSRDFDYTSSYFNEGFGFALRIPPPLPAWMNLVYPFSMYLWVSVIGLLLIITPVLYLLNLGMSSSSDTISFQEAALEVLRGIVRQSSPHIFSSNVVRLVLASWWIGGLILVVSYTSNLIAVLTVPVFPPTISTIEGLAKSNYRVSMVDYGEFVPEALATSQDDHLKALGDRMDLIFNYEDDEISYGELVQNVLDGRHAIVETYSYLRNLLAHDEEATGKTYVLKEQVYQGALAFFLAKHTPWTRRLDQGLTRLVEAGMVNKWYTDIMSSSSDVISTRKSASKENPLSISNLQGPFMLLVLCLSLATAVFVTEVIFKGCPNGN